MSLPYEQHLYAIMWPNHALVASNLAPEEFGSHYTIGSSRYFHGQVVFAEIKSDFRNEYFEIDRYLKEVVPKPDGQPKRTKFISTYRVLEHLYLDAFMDLFITSVEGKVLRLTKAPYEKDHQPGFIRTYQEICPLSAIVMSHMTPLEFGEFITNLDQAKSAPKVLFTQIDFDIEEFLRLLDANPFHGSPIPNVHPQKLKDQIEELRGNPHKKIKGISLDSAFGRISFLNLRTGFWIAHGTELLFYPIPDHATLERDHYEWLRTLSVQRY